MTLDEEKAHLRGQGRLIRQEAAGRRAPALAERAKENFIKAMPEMKFASPAVVAGYWPLPGELDIRPLLEDLHARGFAVALPAVVERGSHLVFRRWRPGLELEEGPHGTSHPGPAEKEVRPGVVLTPLIAYDLSGHRLGQGGGYYDRTLEALRAGGEVLAVGFAFAAQRVDAVPHNAYDQPLDWIVTEETAHGIE